MLGKAMNGTRTCAHILVAVVVVIAAACTPRASTRVEGTERSTGADTMLVDSGDMPPRARNDSVQLGGRWVTGFENEPAARDIRLQRDCRYTPGAWLLDQRGDSVYAFQVNEQWARGVAAPMEPRPTMATGRLRGHDLALSDGTNRWVLAYDERSGHLRGTLNGKPFWAMRQILDAPREQCIPVP